MRANLSFYLMPEHCRSTCFIHVKILRQDKALELLRIDRTGGRDNSILPRVLLWPNEGSALKAKVTLHNYYIHIYNTYIYTVYTLYTYIMCMWGSRVFKLVTLDINAHPRQANHTSSAKSARPV